jgi:protein gp37
MHPDWARGLRDQCAAANVPFFFKQHGEWQTVIDRDRDDPDWRRDYTNDFADNGACRWLNLDGGRGFHGKGFHVMRRVGKKRAGRLLDGREHNGMPAQVEEAAE